MKEAAAARLLMLQGMRQLQEIGARVIVQRVKTAAGVPPAVDRQAVAAKQQG